MIPNGLQVAPEEMLNLARKAAELLVERSENLPKGTAWDGDFRRELERQLLAPPPEDGRPAAEALEQAAKQILRYSARVDHPRFFGFIPSAPTWPGVLADFMVAGYHINQATMLAMHRDGVIALPAPKGRQGRPGQIVFGPDTEPPLFPAPTTLDEVRPLDLRTVVRATREGKRWNEFVARYHYLGYKTLVDAQMRYAVHDRNGWPIAMLGFSTAAWKLAPRDRFIGWTPQLREKTLPLVVDNPRFLILP